MSVGDPVAVVVAVDAAVVVLESIEVLGLVRASVTRVGDRVGVTVGWQRRRSGGVHWRGRGCG